MWEIQLFYTKILPLLFNAFSFFLFLFFSIHPRFLFISDWSALIKCLWRRRRKHIPNNSTVLAEWILLKTIFFEGILHAKTTVRKMETKGKTRAWLGTRSLMHEIKEQIIAITGLIRTSLTSLLRMGFCQAYSMPDSSNTWYVKLMKTWQELSTLWSSYFHHSVEEQLWGWFTQQLFTL